MASSRLLLPLVLASALAASAAASFGQTTVDTKPRSAASPSPKAKAPASKPTPPFKFSEPEIFDAARRGQTTIVNRMIAAGASVTARDEDGNTPLLLAAASG